MSAQPLTVGGWYGRVGVEILRGGECVAVVGRIQANRLAHLDTVRSANAKRGEQAHLAEVEAKEMERFEALGLARQFAAASALLAAAKDAQSWLEALRDPASDPGMVARGELTVWAALRDAVAKAEGR